MSISTGAASSAGVLAPFVGMGNRDVGVNLVGAIPSYTGSQLQNGFEARSFGSFRVTATYQDESADAVAVPLPASVWGGAGLLAVLGGWRLARRQ